MGREVIRRALTVGAVLAALTVPGVLAAGPAAGAPARATILAATAPVGGAPAARVGTVPTVRVGTAPAVRVGTVPALRVGIVPTVRVAPPAPSGVTLAGDGMAQPVTVQAADNAGLCEALAKQVSWLHTGPPQTGEPAAETRGPGYRLVLLVKDRPVGTYDLYPTAAGGPRIYRPAAQPDRRKVEAGWFFGRLNMTEALRAAGAPLPERPDVVNGGIGGGERVNAQETLDAREDVDRLLAQLRQVLLLNAGVLLVITAGLAGMSLLIRRRI